MARIFQSLSLLLRLREQSGLMVAVGFETMLALRVLLLLLGVDGAGLFQQLLQGLGGIAGGRRRRQHQQRNRKTYNPSMLHLPHLSLLRLRDRCVHWYPQQIGRTFLLRDADSLPRVTRILIAGHPLLLVRVPVAGLLAVGGLIEQRDASHPQVLPALGLLAVAELAVVGLEGAAVLGLNLVGLQDAAVLLRAAHVG